MKFPPEHYPNPGVQHTRAVVALTVVTMCLELFTPTPKSAMEKHMAKLRQWVNACFEQTTKKRLSAGAKRDLERCCDKLAPHVSTATMSDDARFCAWASLIWAAWLFTLDVKNTCPLYSDGRDGQRWRWLLHWLESLAVGLCQIEPRVDEQGTAIYEDAVWALEGVEFQPERERRAA